MRSVAQHSVPVDAAGRGDVREHTPTRKRYWVVILGFAVAFITYVDRAAMGQAALSIRADLHLSTVQLGYVFAAFGLAYSMFELPSGWLGDWIGPRKVLTRIVLWWSFFTAATGFAWNYASMLVMRFLFGMGEAGCYPNLAKVYSTWLPREERLRAEGFKAASGRWGGAITPVIFVYLQQWLGWRGVFQVFAISGVIWAVIFYTWYRDDPRERSGVNAAELDLIGSGPKGSGHRDVPWGVFLRSRSAWLLWANWFCYSYGFYFYLTWLPTYLQQARHMNLQKTAALAGLPLFSAGLGSIFSGFVCAWLLQMTRRIVFVRRAIAITGFASAAILLIVFTRLDSPLWTVVALTASSFTAEFAGPVTWTTCMDLGGRYVGSLAGAMNTLGQLGGTVAPAVIGYILKWTGYDWPIVFYVSAGVYGCGILCWTFLDPATSLDRDLTKR